MRLEIFHSILDRVKVGLKLNESSYLYKDEKGNEVYVEQMFKNTKTQKLSSNIEDLLLNKKTTLLQAADGSLCAKLMQEWVTGEKIQDIVLLPSLKDTKDTIVNSGLQSNLHLQHTHSVEAADQVLCSKWLQSAEG